MFDPLTLAEAAALHTLSSIMHPERLARVALHASLDESQMSLDELFLHLRELLVEEHEGIAGAIHRRVVSVLLSKWRALYADSTAAPEVRAVAAAALQRSLRDLKAGYRSGPAYRDFYHFENRLTTLALKESGAIGQTKPVQVPPGSPIGAIR